MMSMFDKIFELVISDLVGKATVWTWENFIGPKIVAGFGKIKGKLFKGSEGNIFT